MILIFDDEKSVRENFIKEIKGQKIGLEIIESETKADLKQKLSDKNLMAKARVIIFDLSTSKEEAESGKFEVLEFIKDNYDSYALPIFIHSAFSELVVGYDNVGTVFKIKKDTDTVKQIIDQIKRFYDSGFLELFCPNGYLEKEIHKAIHKSFNTQFQGEEILNIIASIPVSDSTTYKLRTRSIFERIAIRSLYQNLISAREDANSEKIEEVQINAVEHYYRRTSDFPVWTGDIFISNDNHQVIVLTPRCDINNGVSRDQFLVCEIDPIDPETSKKISKEVNKYLTDNPQQSGIKYRFLIPTPNYIGGKVDLTKYSLMNIEVLTGAVASYQYLISLSDELTNDIVRKFASYILRGGISASEISEASYYSSI